MKFIVDEHVASTSTSEAERNAAFAVCARAAEVLGESARFVKVIRARFVAGIVEVYAAFDGPDDGPMEKVHFFDCYSALRHKDAGDGLARSIAHELRRRTHAMRRVVEDIEKTLASS